MVYLQFGCVFHHYCPEHCSLSPPLAVVVAVVGFGDPSLGGVVVGCTVGAIAVTCPGSVGAVHCNVSTNYCSVFG